MARRGQATVADAAQGNAGTLVRREPFDEWRKLVEIPGKADCPRQPKPSASVILPSKAVP